MTKSSIDQSEAKIVADYHRRERDFKKIMEASVEKEQTLHGSKESSPKNILPKRKLAKMRHKSQGVLDSKGNSPRKNYESSVRDSSTIGHPSTLATAH